MTTKHGVFQMINDEENTTHNHGMRSSVLDNIFGIDIEDEPAEVMEGLRGDAVLYYDEE